MPLVDQRSHPNWQKALNRMQQLVFGLLPRFLWLTEQRYQAPTTQFWNALNPGKYSAGLVDKTWSGRWKAGDEGSFKESSTVWIAVIVVISIFVQRASQRSQTAWIATEFINPMPAVQLSSLSWIPHVGGQATIPKPFKSLPYCQFQS